MRKTTCSAIVCAYNEEVLLGGVLESLASNPDVDEVIVVDDGSRDQTARIMHSLSEINPRIIPIFLTTNHGKGWALAEGILRSRGELLLLVDADLTNWNEDFARQVMEPVLAGKTELSIGYPLRENDKIDRFDLFGLIQLLSGQRAFWRKDILPLVEMIRTSRFGVETLMYLSFRQQGKRISCFSLLGLAHITKLEKETFPGVILSYGKETVEILKSALKHRDLSRQVAKLEWNERKSQAQQAVVRGLVEALNSISSEAQGLRTTLQKSLG
ncbi:MAG TPA: glycosyltransferase [Anaerolineaceae bacterium]|nr:glycosyltransferase [Anaerolineaceae bacterium]HPN50599.1 glycosyltransferase [Anaerolineaceae bacterium]